MWTEAVLLIESAMGLCLSSLNVAMLLRWLRAARTQARRVAVFVLTSVCAAQGLEAALFLAQQGPGSADGAWADAAMLLTRSFLTGSTVLISVLLLRASARR